MEGIGGGMNISSGVFTAPRGGVYTFSFHGMRLHHIPGKGVECVVRLVKNGINILTGFSQLDWVPVILTINLKLKQGDKVQFSSNRVNYTTQNGQDIPSFLAFC